ncbi:UDP-N-acetylmuramoylalanine--D-glutamate ligase MurD [Thermoanaerobacter kivui]|uniref:UDP-N-acetylmuramoylalanine--D-glutamate ligase n=1 Tax=Thermoanaerobacter kivui TaxID=2325 RepID=A0A097ASB7_THEKI|nr:UDP-N-acetylmuramoyl-L-alanine--D-glutamate ligase [Thermoanaerobacter kivui]AIS52709.1 UDP-N-acetylmuramoylalanine--D-glutamate ligase MurD [Thermoanaerobacter kivui]
MEVRNKKVFVAGLGLSGIALCKVLIDLKAHVIAYDEKDYAFLKDNIAEIESLPIEFKFGKFKRDTLKGVDLVVISPGVPVDSELVKEAQTLGIEVLGEVEFAYRFSKGPIYAITGTNGKTTTTSLLGEIFKNAGKNVYVAGNIGYPLIYVTTTATEKDAIVAEISSFQLETVKEFRPKISCIINITPDHLNRHKTFENYRDVKGRIFENQGENEYTVLNYDDEVVLSLAKKAKCKVFPFSKKKILEEGAYVKDGSIYISFEGSLEKIIDVEDIYIPGEHNLENALAASSMAYIAGIDANTIAHTLKTFKGVEHRIEFVDEIEGIKFYNDSKGTNPDASIKAIQALKTPIILIAGGYDKGSEFDEFVKAFGEKVKKLILIGQTAKKIRDTAVKHSYLESNIIFANTLEEAVKKAYENAMRGDSVLLSPACASWDMFKNFEERGKVFKKAVAELRR